MSRRLFAAVVALLAFSLASPTRADWQVHRSAFDPALIQRYKQLLHRDPTDSDALRKLVALYKRHKTLGDLARELTATAAQSHAAADWLAVGALATLRNDAAAARRAYDEALKLAPDDARALVALGDLDSGDHVAARARYEAALPHVTAKKPRRALLQKLADLALAPDRGLSQRQALKEARRYYDEILALEPTSDDARQKWADALASHGDESAAAAEWRTLANHLARDPARQGQAYLRVGELAEAAGDEVGARAAYDKAYSLAPREHYLRQAAAEKLLGLARKHDALRPLVESWERLWPERGRNAFEWDLIGRVYDELGVEERALESFRRALALDPRALDVRRRLIALYTRTGHDAEAVAEYRRLAAAAPGEARFRLELAERLFRLGQQKEALSIARALGAQSSDPALRRELAEMYTRFGLPDLALKELELLTRLQPDDEGHIVALGELYWQKGNKKRALGEWRRLGARPGAQVRLGEIYVEHDMAEEALDLFERARKADPNDLAAERGLASTLERLHRDRDAEELWQRLFEGALVRHDRAAELEARQRLLTVAARGGRLGVHAAEYRARADAEKKDEAKRTAYALVAVDALAKMGRSEMAERILRELGDGASSRAARADALLGLAQLYRQRHRLADALITFERVLALAPDRGRELYPQMAELALMLYQDADAERYARRAVEQAPADAAAHLKLAEVLDKREQLDDAAAAYERALEIDDRQWKVYFTLARLCVRRGQMRRAAELYRSVMRRAPDEETVVDAARRAIDLEEYTGTLADLERELAPLAEAHHATDLANKQVWRSLLAQLYDRYGTPLVARAHDRGDRADELSRFGEHALRPLLEVLAGGEPHEKKIAIELLGGIGQPSAAPALFKLALAKGAAPPRAGDAAERERRGGDIELRERAALAAAEVATRRDLPSLAALLSSREKQLRVAAAYGLGRLADKKARALLTAALDDGAADVQAMVCLALGAHPDDRALDGMLARAKTAPPSEAGEPVARLGCLYGLAVAAPLLSASDRQRARIAAATLLSSPSPSLQRAAAFALGALGAGAQARKLARAAFTLGDEARAASLLALAGQSTPLFALPLARDDDGIDVRGTLARLAAIAITPRDGAVPNAIEVALQKDEHEVADAVAEGLAGAYELRTLDDLAGASPTSIEPLLPRLLPSLHRTATDHEATTRARAARLAAHLGQVDLLALALQDPSPSVRLAALSALAEAGPLPDSRARVAPLVARALFAADWQERRLAALAARAHPELWPDKGAAVLRGIAGDASGFVREALR